MLSRLGMALMDHFSLVETLDLDRRKLQSTLETIEQGYNACVYHNRLHAADVMHGVFCLLLEAVCVRASPKRASSLHACACIRVLWPRASFWLPAINQPTPDPSAKEKRLPFAPIALDVATLCILPRNAADTLCLITSRHARIIGRGLSRVSCGADQPLG